MNKAHSWVKVWKFSGFLSKGLGGAIGDLSFPGACMEAATPDEVAVVDMIQEFQGFLGLGLGSGSDGSRENSYSVTRSRSRVMDKKFQDQGQGLQSLKYLIFKRKRKRIVS